MEYTKEELDRILKERREHELKISEGYPEIFRTLFDQDVHMGLFVSSCSNSAAHRTYSCEAVQKVHQELRRHEWKNNNLPSLLPELLRFVKMLSAEPCPTENGQVFRHLFEAQIIACYGLLTHFTEFKEGWDYVVEQCSVNRYEYMNVGRENQLPYLDMCQSCALHYLVWATTAKLTKTLLQQSPDCLEQIKKLNDFCNERVPEDTRHLWTAF